MSRRLSELRSDLLQIEKRVEALRESIRAAEMELLRQNAQPPASHEDTLVARIVEGVFSRLATTPKVANNERKQYLREKEAAQYMGVSVSALRSWRTKRSKNGPPYTRVGRMVLYPVRGIDDHMRTRTVTQTA
ncbi:MAG TPA: hypothetical protein VEV41_03495 [Terriglobales bacterium]|nr:hypothetical protein [Terriglobales bacterium]